MSSNIQQFVPLKKVGTSITPKVSGDSINSAAIGTVTPAAGAFTTLKASTDPVDADGVGDRGYNDARYMLKDLDATTSTDPATNAAVSTSILDGYGGVIITLTGAGNAQTLQTPTDTAVIKRFIVVTDDANGANTIEVNGITMSAGEAQRFIWDGSAWVAITAVDADDIAFTPSGDIIATNVQTAIQELDDEKVAKAGDTMTGDLNQGGNYLVNSASVNALNAKGQGMQFDGTDDFISIPDATSLDFGSGDFSVCGSIKSIDTSNAQFLIQKGKEDNTPFWRLYLRNSDPYARFSVSDVSTTIEINSAPTNYIDGNEHFVIGVRDGDNVLLYADGDLIQSVSGASGIDVDNNEVVNIGRQAYGATPEYVYSNSQSGIRYAFNRALTAAEAKAFSSGAPIPFADIGADNVEQTSGTLEIGKRYRLKDFIAGDDFSNIGATNEDGNEFIATGTTPTTWTNSSIIVQIGGVLNLEQSGIGHNQWLDNSGNENHGAVTGAVPINLETNHVEKVVKKTVTGDSLWTGIIPAGYILERMIFEETAGNAAILDLGTSDGANDVFTDVTIAASDITVVEINKMFSSSATQTLDLNDDQAGSSWNSASMHVTLMMRRIQL